MVRPISALLPPRLQERFLSKVSFQVQNGNILSYSWDFISDDGIAEDTTKEDPTYVFSTSGSYKVTLTSQVNWLKTVTSYITIQDNGMWGIFGDYNPGTWLPGAPDVETRNNSIDSNTLQSNPIGIGVECCNFEPYNEITNNLIKDNRIGVKIVDSNVVMSGNIFSGNSVDIEEE